MLYGGRTPSPGEMKLDGADEAARQKTRHDDTFMFGVGIISSIPDDERIQEKPLDAISLTRICRAEDQDDFVCLFHLFRCLAI